jgi:hypothetical protein
MSASGPTHPRSLSPVLVQIRSGNGHRYHDPNGCALEEIGVEPPSERGCLCRLIEVTPDTAQQAGGRAELLERQRLVSQFAGLERRTARGGRDSIDHAPRGMLTPAMSHELTRFCLTAGEDDQKPYWAGRVF